MTHVSALPVLLVDDNPQVLHSTSIVLRTSGVAQVITIEDALLTEALSRADGHQGVASALLGLSRPA